jgi:hypothetical protein
VAAQRGGVGRQVPDDDPDALRHATGVEAGAHPLGDPARLGVGPGCLEQRELRVGPGGLGLRGLRRPVREARAQRLAELGGGVAPQRIRGVRRVVEEDVGSAGSHQRLEQRARRAGDVGEAVHEHGAGLKQLGPVGEQIGGPGEGEGAVAEAQPFEAACGARRNAHEGGGALAERRRSAALGQRLEQARRVRGLEAGVEQIVDGGARGGVAVAEVLERSAEGGLPPRLAAHEDPDQGVGPRERELRALQHLPGEAAERLHPHPHRGTAAGPHQARADVLPEAPRRHHDADGTREQPLELRGLAARLAKRASEGREALEQRLLGGPRAALDLDHRRGSSLHRPQHTAAA